MNNGRPYALRGSNNAVKVARGPLNSMLVVYHKARPPSVSYTSDLLQSLSVTLYYPYLSTVTDELSILAAQWLKGQLISVYYLNKSHDWL